MVQMISWLQVNSVKPIGDQDLGSQNLSTGPKQARTKNLNTFASQQFATDRWPKTKTPLRVAVVATIQLGRSDPFVSLPWLLRIEA